MNFYIASSFANIETVTIVSEKLKGLGHSQTYDWTLNGRASTIAHLKEIGLQEKQAVLDADIVVILLPAGKGSHVEMGIALGHHKKVFLYSPTGEVNDFNATSTFYHLPEVEIIIGKIDELVDRISESAASLERIG